MNNLKIIGISGKAGSGKDYLAKIVQERGYYPISLAWHFKIWIVATKQATYEEVFHTKPPHVRHLLQQEGTERGRNVYGENIWVDTMLVWMKHYNEMWGIDKFVCPDVRFKNELFGLKSNGAAVIRIFAPTRVLFSGLNETARQHISEVDLDDVEESAFYKIINNEPENAESVREIVNETVSEYEKHYF